MEATGKHFRKRAAILSCLRCSHAHPSAEWIYARLKPDFPDLSLATVYRNLSLFKQQGLIASLGTVSGVERFDGDTTPHAHFICCRCGQVTDLPGVLPPEAMRMDVQQRTGGVVAECSLTFTGLCKACQENQDGGEPA